MPGNHDGSDDAQLVKAAQAGDRCALEDLLRRHHDMVHAVCRRVTGNDTDGMDATQEALIAIVRGLHRFDNRAKFTTWAYRVATNAALDELRRRSRRPAPTSHTDDSHIQQMAAPHDPADSVLRLDLDDALAALPEDYRVAVILRDVTGCDYAEIGRILRIPPGTVRSRIARGRARLAEVLRPQHEADDPREADPRENEVNLRRNPDMTGQRHSGRTLSHE